MAIRISSVTNVPDGVSVVASVDNPAGGQPINVTITVDMGLLSTSSDDQLRSIFRTRFNDAVDAINRLKTVLENL